MQEIIEKIEIVYANPERESTCVLCNTTFWVGTDLIMDDGSEIIVSPCKCYMCYEDDFEDEII